MLTLVAGNLLRILCGNLNSKHVKVWDLRENPTFDVAISNRYNAT